MRPRLAKAHRPPAYGKEIQDVAKLLNAVETRERILGMLKAQPDGVTTADLIEALYGTVKSDAEHKRGAQRVSFALSQLRKSKHVAKYGGMFGVYKILNGRPVPEVGDLPVRRGRQPGSKNKSKNGSANGDLQGYILRDIRAKLAELEALL